MCASYVEICGVEHAEIRVHAMPDVAVCLCWRRWLEAVFTSERTRSETRGPSRIVSRLTLPTAVPDGQTPQQGDANRTRVTGAAASSSRALTVKDDCVRSPLICRVNPKRL